MKLVEKILSFLRKKEKDSNADAPEGFCPNCWGREEYGGKFYTAVKNHDVNINDKDPNVGWVQDYANKNLSGIQLKHEDGLDVCQNCKITYHTEE